MKKLLFVVLAVFAVSVAAFAGDKDQPVPAQPDNRYSFMGNHLGQSVKESKHSVGYGGIFSTGTCDSKRSVPGLISCTKFPTPQDPGKTILWHVDGKLAKIVYLFPQSNYAGMVRSLTAKYGEPKTSNPNETQNRMGAKFSGTDYAWKNISSSLFSVEYYQLVDQAAVMVSDSVLGPELDKRLPNDDPKI